MAEAVKLLSRAVVIEVDIGLSARDWRLYSVIDARHEVANKINRQLEYILHSGVAGKEDFVKKGLDVLAQFDSYGAFDTESRDVLLGIAEQLFRG